MFCAKATDFGVFNLIKNEDGMNHRNLLQDLDLCQGVCDAPANMLGMACFALEDNAEANDGGIASGSGQSGSHGRNLECPRHTYNAEPGFGIVQFHLGGVDHGVDVFAVVTGGDDGEGVAGSGGFGFFDFL